MVRKNQARFIFCPSPAVEGSPPPILPLSATPASCPAVPAQEKRSLDLGGLVPVLCSMHRSSSATTQPTPSTRQEQFVHDDLCRSSSFGQAEGLLPMSIRVTVHCEARRWVVVHSRSDSSFLVTSDVLPNFSTHGFVPRWAPLPTVDWPTIRFNRVPDMSQKQQQQQFACAHTYEYIYIYIYIYTNI